MGFLFGKAKDKDKDRKKQKEDPDDEEYDDGMDLLEWDYEDEDWERNH